MIPNKVDLAWAAGLFEGEGCITLAKNCPRLQLNMTDEDIVRRFHGVLGHGTVSGPWPKKGGKYKPYWMWRVSGTELPQAILAMFWQWLSRRRRARAKEVLSVCHAAPLALQVINRNKKSCPHGHSYSVVLSGRYKGRRYCKECSNARRRKPGGRGPYKKNSDDNGAGDVGSHSDRLS